MNEADPSTAVPAPVWRWICDELGERGARSMDPLVGVVLADARVTKRGEATSTPREVLRYWAWFLDGARRQAHQNEREFLTHARAAGWSDDEIRRWALRGAQTSTGTSPSSARWCTGPRGHRPPAPG